MLPLGIEKPKLIKVTNEGVYILNEDLKDKINKKKLSPSFINAYHKSPGEAVLSNFIEPDLRTEEPIYFARGHWFHSTMEEHFQNPERSLKTLKEDFRNVTKGEPKYSKSPKEEEKNQYRELAQDNSNKEWITQCLIGYNKIAKKENFYDKKVATLYNMGSQKSGVEFFAQTKFSGTSNACLGFVDCIFEDEGGLRIIDWKTGKYHKGDEEYELQQTLYALMLENAGFKVSSAALVFPIGDGNGNPVLEEINIKDPEVQKKVMERLVSVDEEFEKNKEEWFFPFRKHKWNSWESFLTGNGTAYKPKIDEDAFYQIAEIDVN